MADGIQIAILVVVLFIFVMLLEIYRNVLRLVFHYAPTGSKTRALTGGNPFATRDGDNDPEAGRLL
jgi:hypothetical protein